ncbi:MAG: hypothetical protein K2M91_09770 [Lachnospiraceae bacterium]|nr:hypothetical protein [Lachnospiraceae bacterium]
MKKELKINNRFLTVFTLGILLCALCMGQTGMAEEEEAENQDFTIEVNQLPFSWDKYTYDIQVTVGNQGEDWEGTAQVQVVGSYSSQKCFYDTAISLPQGSTKQFMVRIPVESDPNIDETVRVSLLDKQSNISATMNFRRFLTKEIDSLTLGILSDSYSALTYMDLGGKKLYYGGKDLPIKLVELNQNNLVKSLDSLIFLIIDDYNTSILTDEAVDSIKQWVLKGGSLILGTGKRAEDVLSGLDYLGIEYVQIKEETEDIDYPNSDTELWKLTQAELNDTTGRFHVFSDDSMIASRGKGMEEIVPYSLKELGKLESDYYSQEYYAGRLLRNINSYTQIQYKNEAPFWNSYVSSSIFCMFGNGGSHLNFDVLKWIVILYVVFIGPVLYLVLRYMNKRDLYWIAVPITTLAGILLIYLAGRGFEVVNTRVYSVTIEEASGMDSDDEAWTYMRCYDAGHKEWGLQLAEKYEYVGSVLGPSDFDGSYHIYKEGDRISFGMNPNASFDDGYFKAGTSEKLGTGSITSDLKYSEHLGMMGNVTNGTNRDFKYFAVIMDDNWYFYENLPAGKTVKLDSLDNSKYTFGAFASSMYDYVDRICVVEEKKDIDIVTALGIGICGVRYMYGADVTAVIGVTEDWDKAVDDNCSETSFGCLYTIQ